jgi:hypothetical protein
VPQEHLLVAARELVQPLEAAQEAPVGRRCGACGEGRRQAENLVGRGVEHAGKAGQHGRMDARLPGLLLGDGGLIDAAGGGELRLRHPLALAQLADALTDHFTTGNDVTILGYTKHRTHDASALAPTVLCNDRALAGWESEDPSSDVGGLNLYGTW